MAATCRATASGPGMRSARGSGRRRAGSGPGGRPPGGSAAARQVRDIRPKFLQDYRDPSLHEALDTTTPGGRLVFHVFAALAEFIRELIVEGTREGLDAARTRGVRLGRPPAMTAEQIRHARDLLTRPDNTVSSIAGCSASAEPPSTSTYPSWPTEAAR